MGAALTDRSVLRLPEDAPYRTLVGVGGIGAGILFTLEGDQDLGRNESRSARLIDARDYCKLHIIAHYPAVLLADGKDGGFRVLPVGKLGADDIGGRLRREMTEAGMDTSLVESVEGAPTLFSVCFQYPDGSGGNLTTVDSAAAHLTAVDVDRSAPFLDSSSIALAAPEVPLEARLRLLDLATQHNAFRVASFTSGEIREARRRGALATVDLLALNEDEAAALTEGEAAGADPTRFLKATADAFAKANPRGRLLLSLGARGAYAWEGRWHHVPALPVVVKSTAGAGDALLGGTLTGLALGLPFENAVELGSLTAAFKVTSPHTIPPDFNLAALRSFAADHGVTLSPRLAEETR